MASIAEREKPTWYLSHRFRVIALLVLAFFALGEGVVGIFFRDNDFSWHRHFGEAFLNGDPYVTGGVHYPPARAMLNAVTAWLPYRVDRTVVYLAALATLAWTLLAWRRLANLTRPLHGAAAFAAVAFTLVIGITYIQRDLDDCGLQILLLFFLTAAVVNLQAGRARGCGFWLGLAAVYKITPLLFLPYLCYKGRWRAAAWMVACIGVFCLVPALWLGWDGNAKAHERWLASTHASLTIEDPTENGIEPPTHRNQSLTVAIARFVETYPPGHVLSLDHPLFAQPGNMEPAAAKRVVQGVLLLLAGVLAWRFRKSFSESAGELPRQWAAVTMLAAILSPFCWLQHLVLVLPAVFLVVHAALGGGLSPWRRRLGWLAAIIMIFAGQRDLLGHSFFMLVMSYKVHTWAALTALAMVLSLRAPPRAGGISLAPNDQAQPRGRAKELAA